MKNKNWMSELYQIIRNLVIFGFIVMYVHIKYLKKKKKKKTYNDPSWHVSFWQLNNKN